MEQIEKMKMRPDASMEKLRQAKESFSDKITCDERWKYYNIISALAHTAKAFEREDKRSIESTATLIMTPSFHAQEVKVQNLWGAYNTRSLEIDKDDLKDFLEDM